MDVAGVAPQYSFEKTLKGIVNVIRIAYLIFAVTFVFWGLYSTLMKVQQQNIHVRLGIDHASKIRFPSVTFCYKYKHGSKEALLGYNYQLFDRWKKSGNNKWCKNMCRDFTFVHCD